MPWAILVLVILLAAGRSLVGDAHGAVISVAQVVYQGNHPATDVVWFAKGGQFPAVEYAQGSTDRITRCVYTRGAEVAAELGLWYVSPQPPLAVAADGMVGTIVVDSASFQYRDAAGVLRTATLTPSPPQDATVPPKQLVPKTFTFTGVPNVVLKGTFAAHWKFLQTGTGSVVGQGNLTQTLYLTEDLDGRSYMRPPVNWPTNDYFQKDAGTMPLRYYGVAKRPYNAVNDNVAPDPILPSASIAMETPVMTELAGMS